MKTFLRKYAIWFMLFGLWFSSIVPSYINEVHAQNAVLTKSQAIANNSGAATAERYPELERVQSTAPNPTPIPVEVSIAEAKELLGQTVTIQGVVTADNTAITAILIQYDSCQLIPRKLADLAALKPQPPAPSAAGE